MAKAIKRNPVFLRWSEKILRQQKLSNNKLAKKQGKDTFGHEGLGMRKLKHHAYTIAERKANKVFKKH